MLVKLTNAMNKTTLCLNTNIILVVERDASNPLLTRVITSLTGRDGMIAYNTIEGPEEVADLIAKVLGKEPVPMAKPEATIAS